VSGRKVIRMELEWDDGEIQQAVGDDADAIWKDITDGYTFRYIHGMPYKGPMLKTIRKAGEK
jgi:hypothetical protein